MKVTVAQEAQKQFARLPKAQQIKLKRKLQYLENNPILGKKLVGELANYYSLRAWPYRIIYRIDITAKEIIIRSILHRQGAYK